MTASNHLCISCQRDCDCDGLHMLTDCTRCTRCRYPYAHFEIAIFNGTMCWGRFTDWRNVLAVLPPEALRMRWEITVGDHNATVIMLGLHE
jgi:hypothetical protein